MYIYALGKSLLWASDYMRIPYSSAVISTTLQSLLMGMSDNNPMTRLGLVQILEVGCFKVFFLFIVICVIKELLAVLEALHHIQQVMQAQFYLFIFFL